MSSLTTTWSPSSFQLRLALNCKKSSGVVVRVRFQKLNYRPMSRIFCVAEGTPKISGNNGKGNKIESGNEPGGSGNSVVDGFAGWSGSEQDGNSNSSQLGGIVGAGLAGTFLVAGLTFAALAIGKKRTSKSIQHMEPLTVQQETSLASDDHDELFEQKNKDVNDMPHTSSQESEAGINQDTSLYHDNSEVSESGNMVNYDEGLSSNDRNMSSGQQSLQKETSIDDTYVVTESGSNATIAETGGYSNIAPSFDKGDGSVPESKDENLVNGTPDSVTALESSDLYNDSITSDFVTDRSMIDPSVFDASTETLSSIQQEVTSGLQETEDSLDSSFGLSNEGSITSNIPVGSQLDTTIEPQMFHEDEGMFSVIEVNKESADLLIEKDASTGSDVISPLQNSSVTEEDDNGRNDANVGGMSPLDSTSLVNNFTSAGVPAPSLVSEALQSHPGKVLVPATVDPVQGQALAALQALKVIETVVQPGDLCTRREYARWLVSASSALSRNTISKVYPAMYIENITELAYDDITPEDPDFPFIQGLAEAGLISSKLSKQDVQPSSNDEHTPLYFSPESPLSRQDLVSWKMALERRQLPVVNRKSMEQASGFLDIDKIHSDAWPALVADLALGEHGIVALAFGYTRLFQPDKPVTNAQAAVALATGEASDIVNEELTRIEAETMAEKAVAAQSELVAQVEKEINASFEKDLMLQREKVIAVEKLTDETRQELERLKSQREEENLAIMKERAAVDSEMEVFSRLRRELEEQLQTLMSNKVEISYEKELLQKLRNDAESENREIARLQFELEVERKALSIARAWAEDEAKRAKEQAKSLEEARGRWESRGIKVIVDDDLQEEANAAGVAFLSADKEFSVEGTVERAETLVDRLKGMADVVRGRSKDIINMITQKIVSVISVLKELALKAGKRAEEVKDAAFSKMSSSLEEVQQSSSELTSNAREGIKRVVIDCKDGVGKFSQKFKT